MTQEAVARLQALYDVCKRYHDETGHADPGAVCHCDSICDEMKVAGKWLKSIKEATTKR